MQNEAAAITKQSASQAGADTPIGSAKEPFGNTPAFDQVDPPRQSS
jgi:hypothetical protein